jgi:heat shock protein HslJ
MAAGILPASEKMRGCIEMKPLMLTALVATCLQLAGCAAEGPATPPAPKALTLENTYWKLTRIGETPVEVAKDPREPHLVLQARDKRVDGANGCGRLRGSYLTQGSSVSFVQIASGKTGECLSGVSDGQAMQRALASVSRWRIVGRELELMNEREATLARFSASE